MLRKSMLVLFVCAIFNLSFGAKYAQDKGSYQVGGNFGFESKGGDLYKNADDDRSNKIIVNPEIAYFFIEGLSLGMKVNFENTSQGDNKTTVFGGGPSLTYYIGNSKSILYPYFNASFLYNHSKNEMKISSQTIESKYDNTQIYLALGGLYMMSNAVGMNMELFYRIDKNSPDEGDSVSGNVFGFMVGFKSFIF